ncbi:MAG: DUF4062 domain-containing protein [Methanothrix sp.]|nr:DUF4062 domain-containing protein [Methanothrix sp.]MDD4447931.1 DUF4062 domain-containing protein [Methanothrix sp.]
MEKRYQIFVSSTYQDLQEERQEVMHALLELDCIPAGMELFPAADESQWSLIKRVIEECDYYVLILGGRYGSCGPDGLSYTEMEYRYALEIGKPTIAFLHKDPGTIQSNKCETTQEGKEKLVAFRSFVEKKLCKQWASPSELGSVVSRSLIQLMKTTPAIGWVRADELPDRNATLELLKLRQRVDELQAELARSRTAAPKGTEDLAQGEELHILRYSFSSENKIYDTSDWTGTFQATWNEIFAVLAPLMINEASERTFKAGLDRFSEDRNRENLTRDKDLTDCMLSNFSLNGEDFQTIKVQLRALGLIAKSEKARSVKDNATYWTLTPYGDDVMTRLRAIKRAVVVKEPPEAAKQKKRKTKG